jgi:hypothetical protein
LMVVVQGRDRPAGRRAPTGLTCPLRLMPFAPRRPTSPDAQMPPRMVPQTAPLPGLQLTTSRSAAALVQRSVPVQQPNTQRRQPVSVVCRRGIWPVATTVSEVVATTVNWENHSSRRPAVTAGAIRSLGNMPHQEQVGTVVQPRAETVVRRLTGAEYGSTPAPAGASYRRFCPASPTAAPARSRTSRTDAGGAGSPLTLGPDALACALWRARQLDELPIVDGSGHQPA